MGTLFALIAGLCGSIFSYTMRKSIDGGGTTNGFTTTQILFCIFFTIGLGPLRTGHYEWNSMIAVCGITIGLILGLLYWMLGKSLQKGPAGLVFAIVNSACIMPALMMTAFFGISFGYNYTMIHAIGSLLVLAGLFWAGKRALKESTGFSWLPFALITFLLQTVFLTSIQWRSLHLMPQHPENSLLLPISNLEASCEWFLPMMFFGAFLSHLLLTLKLPSVKEFKVGLTGGLFNGLSIFFLMLATQFANDFEKTILFPTSAVTVILLCHGWGQAIYKEKPNWVANIVCALGVLIPSLF